MRKKKKYVTNDEGSIDTQMQTISESERKSVNN